MGRFAHVPLLLLIAATSVGAAPPRASLGLYESWAAFRDASPARCYAIAEPVRGGGMAAPPFATIAYWPGAGARGQLHVHLRQPKRRGAPVMLAIGDRRFLLASGGAEAWAPDAAGDAAIVAAMRGASSMSVEAVTPAGRPFADTYRLHGAATAIDAAALACVKAPAGGAGG